MQKQTLPFPITIYVESTYLSQAFLYVRLSLFEFSHSIVAKRRPILHFIAHIIIFNDTLAISFTSIYGKVSMQLINPLLLLQTVFNTIYQ